MIEIINIFILAVVIALVLYIIIVKSYNNRQKMNKNPVGNTEMHTDTFEKYDEMLSEYVDSISSGSSINKKPLLKDNDAEFAKEFKNKYFEFKDKVNQSSDMGIDPVDNINKFAYGDFEQVKGKKIGDIYDEILNIKNGILLDKKDSNLKYSSDSGKLLDGGNGKMYDGYHWLDKDSESTMANDVSVNTSMAY